MATSRRLAGLLAVCIGVAVVGFLRGTSQSDYDFHTPLTQWGRTEHDEVPVARSYLEQHEEDDGSDVAGDCLDCHEARQTSAESGAHREHPIGLPLPEGADLTALLAGGARLDLTTPGERKVSCRSCHRPHNPAQRARLTIGVEDGELCVACHASERPGRSEHPVSGAVPPKLRASIAAIGGAAAGELTCTSCHAVHDAASGGLLRTSGAGAAACRSCHATQALALGTDGHGGQSCEDCHGMHDAPAHLGKGPRASEDADQACADCHVSGGEAPQVAVNAGHPIGVQVTPKMAAAGHPGTVGCGDCHVAHGHEDRLLAEATVAATCLDCHPEKETVTGTRHDATVVSVAGADTTCLSCHAVHGRAADQAHAEENPANAVCLSCHDGSTGATTVGPWSHPVGVLLTVSGLPFRYSGPVPYFGPDGERSTDRAVGEITCQTCHDVHRWRHGESLHPGDVEGTEQNSFLRDPDEVVEFCTACHGNDARPNFRFFHSASYRAEQGGPEVYP